MFRKHKIEKVFSRFHAYSFIRCGIVCGMFDEPYWHYSLPKLCQQDTCISLGRTTSVTLTKPLISGNVGVATIIFNIIETLFWVIESTIKIRKRKT